ncbi:hypothetical protein Ddye_000397 [Dipteronia dyeriana]|uniref:Uncharacterized protein n=1 Tax=Dipteronia dyeriana TaxID=168575 RepID=A0AAD9XMW2_9ROSI|nr:hypothetical protein Ddye_000397 [Dipteronia dyeriana]
MKNIENVDHEKERAEKEQIETLEFELEGNRPRGNRPRGNRPAVAGVTRGNRPVDLCGVSDITRGNRSVVCAALAVRLNAAALARPRDEREMIEIPNLDPRDDVETRPSKRCVVCVVLAWWLKCVWSVCFGLCWFGGSSTLATMLFLLFLGLLFVVLSFCVAS